MNKLSLTLKNTDIYIIDQILKNRYSIGETILDAGCGSGRNLYWFYHNNFTIYGIDQSAERIEQAQRNYANQSANFSVGKVEDLPFEKENVDHVICSAVLHFAQDETHFHTMFAELLRVLKIKGSLFIRIASNLATKNEFKSLGLGRYSMRDGTDRFLLTQKLLDDLLQTFPIKLLEPIKTTNVDDVRCMTTLVFEKTSSK